SPLQIARQGERGWREDGLSGCPGARQDLTRTWHGLRELPGANRVDPASCPAGPPTDPDVRVSRIRLFETQFCYATQMAWTIRGPSSGYLTRRRLNRSQVIFAFCDRRCSHLRHSRVT